MSEHFILSSRIHEKSTETLSAYLCRKFRYFDQAAWEERIADGRIQVNDRPASSGQMLRKGDVVSYATGSWSEPPVNTDYKVLYEDDVLLALSKPAPLPVHSIGAYFQNTLMSLLRRDRPEARDFNLVHRLDRETSGVLLLCKRRDLLGALQKSWRRGDVHKEYRAIVFGKFAPAIRTVEAAIGRAMNSRIRMKLGVDHVRGKAAVTRFEVMQTKGAFTMLRVFPLTGRTHQIRVHLEALGHPIVGDKLYSGEDATFLEFLEHGWTPRLAASVGLSRLALHAAVLRVPHPLDNKEMSFEDPLPPELTGYWENLPD
jgi:RluA family pseudouridine synthase